MSTKKETEKLAIRLQSIDQTLAALREYWYARPYLRLGQIVSNAWQVHPDYKRNPEPEINDVYYLADSKFEEGLQLLIKNESKSTNTPKD
jgi:hypothetical protein